MKRILFVHCCYSEHLSWILPIIRYFIEEGFICHLYPTHWDAGSMRLIDSIFKSKRFKLLRSSNRFSSLSISFGNRLLRKFPGLNREKQIAIESYKEPGQRFLKKGESIPEGFYDSKIFEIVQYNKRYHYDVLIAHGIHANVISNFAWHYLNCPKWISDRGFIKGSIMLDSLSTENDDSELQKVKIPPASLSPKSKDLLKKLDKPLIENQTSRNFEKPKEGKNLLYALSRIRNEVNIKGCLKGQTELQIIKSLAENLPEGWNLIAKVRGKYKLILGEEKLPGNVYIAEGNIDINYLIEMSEAVISFISKIGLAAAVKGKVVLTMGAAHYSHFGFTRDLEKVEQLKLLLQKGPLGEIEIKNLHSFLEYYLRNYLIFPDRKKNPMLDKIIETNL